MRVSSMATLDLGIQLPWSKQQMASFKTPCLCDCMEQGEQAGIDLVHRLGTAHCPFAVSLPFALDLGDLQQLIALSGDCAQRAACPAVQGYLLVPMRNPSPNIKSMM